MLRAKSTRRHGFTMFDLIVSLVLIVLGSTFVLAAAEDEKEHDNRVKCASNLRQIGQAMLLYSNENRGAFPRALYDRKTADKPTVYTNAEAEIAEDEKDKINDAAYSKNGPKPNDVTAAYYRLIRTEDIQPDVFTCPSARALRPADEKQPELDRVKQVNFFGPVELDYSFANPYPSADAAKKKYRLNNSIAAEFVLVGDMNPGGDDLTKITLDSTEDELKKTNSKNHGGDGQNFLYGDGHVEFQTNVFAGVKRDNVYTYGASGDAEGAEKKGGEGIVGSPVGPDDSVLLPTAEQGK